MADEIDDSPLEWGWQPSTLVDVPPEMVISIAMGLEDPDEIASRYGFTGHKWDKLKAWKPFLDTIANQKAEFEKSGLTFRLKAAMKADLLADKVFVDAMSNDVTLMQRLEAMKLFAKLGNLEPKEEKAQGPQTTFSINIDLGDRSVSLGASAAPQTIEAPVKEITPTKLLEDE